MKISVSGVQSTGKTTLIQELIKLDVFKDYHVHESPTRTLYKEYDIKFDTGNTDIQLSTLALQLYHLNQYDNAIFDRTVIDNLAYYLYHKHRHNSNMTKESEYFMYKMSHLFMSRIDLILMLNPEFPIIIDGVRNTDDHQRLEVMNILKTVVLREYNYGEILYLSGSIDDRVKQVLTYIEETT